MSIHALAWGWIDTGAEVIPALWVLPEAALLASCLGTGLVWEGSGQPAQESGPETCRLQETSSGLEFSYDLCSV